VLYTQLSQITMTNLPLSYLNSIDKIVYIISISEIVTGLDEDKLDYVWVNYRLLTDKSLKHLTCHRDNIWTLEELVVGKKQQLIFNMKMTHKSFFRIFTDLILCVALLLKSCFSFLASFIHSIQVYMRLGLYLLRSTGRTVYGDMCSCFLYASTAIKAGCSLLNASRLQKQVEKK